jgi:hypothetical protein
MTRWRDTAANYSIDELENDLASLKNFKETLTE